MSVVSSLLSPTTKNSSSSTSSASTGGASTSNSATSASTVASQYNTFLTMLTTELKNQDPTQPVDSTQFVSQLAQFSQLEQSLQSNTNLSSLIQLGQSAQTSSALGYLGHTVETTGNAVSIDGTTTTNPLNYSLANSASSAVIHVYNAAGRDVRQITTDATAGSHSVNFDGTDDSGVALAGGNYTFKITALDASGSAVAATTYQTGKVTGVDTSTGSALLMMGASSVAASSVVQVTA